MRLFLASDNLGDFADIFVEMIGDNKKVLVITNARDHRTPERRKQVVDEILNILTRNGLDAEELDLRPYFNNNKGLRQFINQKKPGCIFCIGGNFYTLATALKLSGMNNILKEDVVNNKYVYGGYSAGAMNAARNLMIYANTYGRRADDRIEQAKETYGTVSTEGLGFIKEYVCPHADQADYREIAQKTAKLIAADHETAIVLNDADVFIIQDNRQEVLRG